MAKLPATLEIIALDLAHSTRGVGGSPLLAQFQLNQIASFSL